MLSFTNTNTPDITAPITTWRNYLASLAAQDMEELHTKIAVQTARSIIALKQDFEEMAA